MKRFFVFSFLLILMLCSCGKKEELLHYQKYPFEGEFEVFKTDSVFTLRVSGDGWDEKCERALVAEFLAPEDLRGIKISRENGEVNFSLGGIEFEESGTSPTSLCDFASYFELTASPVSFSKENDNTTAHLISEKGENIVITFSREGLPTIIEGEKMKIKVVSYKMKK